MARTVPTIGVSKPLTVDASVNSAPPKPTVHEIAHSHAMPRICSCICERSIAMDVQEYMTDWERSGDEEKLEEVRTITYKRRDRKLRPVDVRCRKGLISSTLVKFISGVWQKDMP